MEKHVSNKMFLNKNVGVSLWRYQLRNRDEWVRFFLQLGVSRLVPDFRRMDFHLLSSDFVLVSQNGWKSSGHF